MVDPHYVFDDQTIREISLFWAGEFKSMLLEGDPSAGKTSLVKQINARLNVPLKILPCYPDMRNADLIGQLQPSADGTLKWVDGPVTTACRNGTSILLDEYNVLEPGEATALNMLLEGDEWTIPQTGETIFPAPTTRFFCTQNPSDSRLMVAGRNAQDAANEDRFFYMRRFFLPAELETQMVCNRLLQLKLPEAHAKTLAELTVKIANKVRSAYRSGVVEIDKPLSTRVVQRWAKLTAMVQFGAQLKDVSGIHSTIQNAVKMSPEMAKAVDTYISMVTGIDAKGKTYVPPVGAPDAATV